MKLDSEAFGYNDKIPVQYTGDGDNISPPLVWSDVPRQTREFALVCEDPDSTYVHWVAYKIPASARSLPEGIPSQPEVEDPIHLMQGKNSSAGVGYVGPMPPEGDRAHRYVFKLYALDNELPDSDHLTLEALTKMMKGAVIEEAELVGKFERTG